MRLAEYYDGAFFVDFWYWEVFFSFIYEEYRLDVPVLFFIVAADDRIPEITHKRHPLLLENMNLYGIFVRHFLLDVIVSLKRGTRRVGT